jgi:hypothetical protein
LKLNLVRHVGYSPEGFIKRARLAENTPGRALDDLSLATTVIPTAVDRFQTHLVELRKSREETIQRDLGAVLDRLSSLETRFKDQLELELGAAPENEEGLSPTEKRRLTLRRRKEQRIDQLFQDWTEWFERTRQMVADPNPHVDVKAVFQG